MEHEYGLTLAKEAANDYDAIIVAVNHREYQNMSESDFEKMMKDDLGIFVDVKGIFKGKISNMEYWSL